MLSASGHDEPTHTGHEWGVSCMITADDLSDHPQQDCQDHRTSTEYSPHARPAATLRVLSSKKAVVAASAPVSSSASFTACTPRPRSAGACSAPSCSQAASASVDWRMQASRMPIHDSAPMTDMRWKG